MTVITASDFLDWKSNPVTKAFIFACNERVEDAKNQLARSAGFDPAQDSFLRGFIHAYQEMQDFRVDDFEGEEIADGN